MSTSSDPFTADDFKVLSGLAIETWQSGLDRDWSVPAGALQWSCRTTAEHTVDAVFSPALNLASRRQHAYAHFDLLRPLPDATIADLVDGLRAVTNMLWALIVTAEPGTRAVIRHRPVIQIAGPQDFAPRGASELIFHTYDISTGLGVRFEPPRDLCSRLLPHIRGWEAHEALPRTDDSWSDLVARSGRPRPL
ncbi:MAG: hypothetical protein WD271_02265 [Acidimicrobiia bacterium]